MEHYMEEKIPCKATSVPSKIISLPCKGTLAPLDKPLSITNRNIALKRMIFPYISNDKIQHLMIDKKSIEYITFTATAQEITNIIMNNLDDFPPKNDNEEKWLSLSVLNRMKKLTITEMTAGVGGNVLNFAKYFHHVNAIEIDNLRYNYLIKNIKLYEFSNVKCYHCDSLKMLTDRNDVQQDIIFFDPPWGGKNYKFHYNLRLNFGNYSIENIIKILFQQSSNKMIVIKLPNNYDFAHVENEFKDFRVSKYVLSRMTIVVIKNYICAQ